MSETPALHCEGVCKEYADGQLRVSVLRGVDLQVQPGDKVAILGASGSGKSTLLNLLGGLDTVSSGRVLLAGKELAVMAERERAAWRNQNLGFVYQFHHLLGEFTALENVAMPRLIGGAVRAEALERAAELLAQVGLAERGQHRPGQLSGGERQRVAIARALANTPGCVLMDEPTGNLDPESAQQVLTLIESLRQASSAFVVVTHDRVVAESMDTVYELRGGRLEELAG